MTHTSVGYRVVWWCCILWPFCWVSDTNSSRDLRLARAPAHGVSTISVLEPSIQSVALALTLKSGSCSHLVGIDTPHFKNHLLSFISESSPVFASKVSPCFLGTHTSWHLEHSLISHTNSFLLQLILCITTSPIDSLNCGTSSNHSGAMQWMFGLCTNLERNPTVGLYEFPQGLKSK